VREADENGWAFYRRPDRAKGQGPQQAAGRRWLHMRKRRKAETVRRRICVKGAAALPVLVLRLGRLLGLDDKKGDKNGDKPEQNHEPGEIEFHGEPPLYGYIS